MLCTVSSRRLQIILRTEKSMGKQLNNNLRWHITQCWVSGSLGRLLGKDEIQVDCKENAWSDWLWSFVTQQQITNALLAKVVNGAIVPLLGYLHAALGFFTITVLRWRIKDQPWSFHNAQWTEDCIRSLPTVSVVCSVSHLPWLRLKSGPALQ